MNLVKSAKWADVVGNGHQTYKLLLLISSLNLPCIHVSECSWFSCFLQTTPHQHDDLKAVRDHIRECFESVSCYLLPSPGTKVQSGDSDGQLEGVLVSVWENYNATYSNTKK